MKAPAITQFFDTIPHRSRGGIFQIFKNALFVQCSYYTINETLSSLVIQINEVSYQKSLRRTNFRWKAVLTAYKIKIKRKLQRLHNFLIRYLIDKGEALFQILYSAVVILYDSVQSVKFSLHQSIQINVKSPK